LPPFVPQNILWVDQCDSSNRQVMKLGAEGAPHGFVFGIEQQDQGRGRRGRSWFSPPGENLLFSILLRPGFSAERIGLLPLLCATTLWECLKEEGLESIGIKWPNDLLLQDKKICGILTEMQSRGGKLSYLVLGIGLNVHSSLESFPEELQSQASSLFAATGRRFSRDQLLQSFLRELARRLPELNGNAAPAFLSRWREASATLGREVALQMPDGSELEGIAEDIDDNGALLLRSADQKLHRLHSGEITRLRPR